MWQLRYSHGVKINHQDTMTYDPGDKRRARYWSHMVNKCRRHMEFRNIANGADKPCGQLQRHHETSQTSPNTRQFHSLELNSADIGGGRSAFQSSSVGIVTDDRGSILGSSREIFSSPPRPDHLCGPPSVLSDGYRRLCCQR
jgi:hypothetical protein